MDLRQHELLVFYPFPDLVISSLDVLRPGMVGRVLRKVDGTLTVAVESVLLLPDTELSNEVLHPYYFLAGFNSRHVLRLRG